MPAVGDTSRCLAGRALWDGSSRPHVAPLCQARVGSGWAREGRLLARGLPRDQLSPGADASVKPHPEPVVEVRRRRVRAASVGRCGGVSRVIGRRRGGRSSMASAAIWRLGFGRRIGRLGAGATRRRRSFVSDNARLLCGSCLQTFCAGRERVRGCSWV